LVDEERMKKGKREEDYRVKRRREEGEGMGEAE
jgi:hypothetical protein